MRVKLLRCRLADGSGPPGAVLGGLTVACGTGALDILAAQRPGKRVMQAEEFLRGVAVPATLD